MPEDLELSLMAGEAAFIQPLLDQRLREFRGEAQEQQKLTAELVFAKLLEHRLNERSAAGRRDRIDLLGGLAVLQLDPARHQFVLFEARKRWIDRPIAGVDEIRILPFNGELSDLISSRVAIIENGKADGSDVHWLPIRLAYNGPAYAGPIYGAGKKRNKG